MENKTPIQEWIEKESNLRNMEFDYDPFFVITCRKLLTYLGLQDIPDPKLEIEALRQMQKDYATKSADLIMARAEDERLREALMKIYTLNIPPQMITDTHFHTVVALRTIADNALKGETT